MDSSSDLILHSQFDCLWESPPENNASDYILRKVQEHAQSGRKECVKNGLSGETLLFEEVEIISRKISSKLSKLGMNRGDIVIYSTHDPAKVHVFMLGVWRANGILRASYPEDIGDVLEKRIRDSKATFLACDEHIAEEYVKVAKKIPWDVQVIVFGNATDCVSIQEFFEDDGAAAPITQTTLEDVAVILSTSGTTGESKGAIYTHRVLLEIIVAFECMPFTDKIEEPTFITSRQTHFCGSVAALSFFTKGRFLMGLPSVSVETLLQVVSKYKIRAIIGFPTYILGLVNHPSAAAYDTSSIHFLTSAGDVVVPEALALIKKLPNLKAFINLYGMTEAGLLVTSADWAAMKNGICQPLNYEKDYTVGKLPPKTSLKVLDIDDGKILGPNRKGELCFKTAIMSAGYFNHPEDGPKTFYDGWVKTGDVGYYDEDGFIYILDRAKEIFKYNTNHISPTEIQNVILRHPSVAEAVVIGVPDPVNAGVAGYIPRAFVVLKPNVTETEDELLEFSQINLPEHKHLRGGLFILPKIPVGKTGKVTRKLFVDIHVPSNSGSQYDRR